MPVRQGAGSLSLQSEKAIGREKAARGVHATEKVKTDRTETEIVMETGSTAGVEVSELAFHELQHEHEVLWLLMAANR